MGRDRSPTPRRAARPRAARAADRYEIHTGAETIAVGPIDQSTQKGWVELGVHEIVAGDEHWVRMRDNTGEARDLDRELAFDAIRWEWEPIADDSGGSSGAGSSETSDGGEGETAVADEGPTTTNSGDDSWPALPPASGDGDRSGCTIAAPSRATGLALVVLALRRRRRAVCDGHAARRKPTS
ncbi:MAG: hypothetical protein IAG13_11670, partial [Deltaproteobacteria bacterium]|nr:hypothetical protein [Nannocystaceae bacterium]